MGIKVSQLTQDSSPTSDDYVLAVDNGTNSSKKVTMGNLVSSASDAMLKSRAETISGNKTLADGVAIVLGTTTGSNIGTDPSQKLGFYNSTPIVQPTGNVITALQNLGLIASATISESDVTNLVSGLAAKMATAIYDPAAIAQQVLGTTATQTMTNKSFGDRPDFNAGSKLKGGTTLQLENASFDSTASISNTGGSGASTINFDSAGVFTQGIKSTRVTKRTGTAASSATPTINTDNVDYYSLTAQAADITSFTTNLSGTPTEGQTLWIAITGTAARAITWGASFEASTVALPTTTVTTNRLDVGFVWNSVTSKFRCVATA